MLKEMMKDETGGDPVSGVKWSRRSTRKLAEELTRRGHPVGADTVGRLQREMGFSLRANVKNLSGKRHPHRERQFQYIRKKRREAFREGIPVLSVDTKKKEIIANFYNAGRIWRDQPREVCDHDFPSEELPRAWPFGIYDVQRNHGTVVVGTSSHTASFGVDALRLWYRTQGQFAYPDLDEVMLLCDNGGCNGSRNRLWKLELQRFANEFGLTVRVSHYPPGASKWNPVEHRLFSAISNNWAGQPLDSYEKMLKYIRTTTTQSGLKVCARLLRKQYNTGVKIDPEQMAQVRLRPSRVLPRWNYAIRPHSN
jgi:hypothetical protein